MPAAKKVNSSAAKASKGKKKLSPVKPVTAKPAAASSEKPKKRVAKQFSDDEKLGIYLRRVLLSVHPETGISKDAMSTINSLILDIYKKIATTAAEIS